MIFFWLSLPSLVWAYDCSHIPFPVKETQSVRITVARLYWSEGIRQDEDVCSAERQVPVQDIQGREEEWFYCNDVEAKLECDTQYGAFPATLSIYPSVVIRSIGGHAKRDTHFHAFVDPEGNVRKRFDLYARYLSSELEAKAFTLDAAGGGRGEDSGQDTYYVRLDFFGSPTR